MSGLSPNAKRLRTIIISFPVLVVTSAILYRRTYMGEEQRRIPQASSIDQSAVAHEKILGRGAGEIGGAPWVVQHHITEEEIRTPDGSDRNRRSSR